MTASSINPAATEHALNLLREWNCAPEAQADGTIVVPGDLSVRKKNLEQLPDLSMVIVRGIFDCSENQLKNLIGGPRQVEGNYNCSYNALTSLEGAPLEVGGNFSCALNQISSLQHAPKKVGGMFSCASNMLTTLEGGPQEVGTDYNANGCGLESLKGAPPVVNGSFYAHTNKLVNLVGGPASVDGEYHCWNNQLESLEGAPANFTGDFSCEKNENLKYLDHAPTSFNTLQHDSGTYRSWSEVPDNIKMSPEARALRTQETREGIRRMAQETTVLAQTVKPLKTIRFKPAKKAVLP